MDEALEYMREICADLIYKGQQQFIVDKLYDPSDMLAYGWDEDEEFYVQLLPLGVFSVHQVGLLDTAPPILDRIPLEKFKVLWPLLKN